MPNRSGPMSRRTSLLAMIAACLLTLCTGAVAETPGPSSNETIRIAVFDFELRDASAGGGIIAPDEHDATHLAASTAEVLRLLGASARFELVDTAGTATAIRAAGGVQNCRGCEAELAARLGAERSLAGVVTRVNRTEFTVQIVIRDAATGEIAANHFSGLRLGATYAWSRGTRSLVSREILTAE